MDEPRPNRDEGARAAPYEPAPGLEGLYGEDSFETRLANDPERLAQFLSEGELIRRYIRSGRAMDIGCSTGEFLEAIDWPRGAHAPPLGPVGAAAAPHWSSPSPEGPSSLRVRPDPAGATRDSQ